MLNQSGTSFQGVKLVNVTMQQQEKKSHLFRLICDWLDRAGEGQSDRW